VADFIDGLPDFLGARDLKGLARAVADAHRGGRTVAFALGGHVVKVGCGPVVADLVERGIVTTLAMNGATAIHDYELAFAGVTSEDVAEGLETGDYGLARETVEALASAARLAAKSGAGLGAEMGRAIAEGRLAHAGLSMLAAAHRKGVPATVHVAYGTDTPHMHPSVSGADVGAATARDFEILAEVVAGLEGGVWVNVGSAVVLPEVFLKCLTLARNLTGGPREFTTANLDMLHHYRPTVNVLKRPGGRAYSVTGQHEIILPLLRTAVLAALETPTVKEDA